MLDELLGRSGHVRRLVHEEAVSSEGPSHVDAEGLVELYLDGYVANGELVDLVVAC